MLGTLPDLSEHEIRDCGDMEDRHGRLIRHGFEAVVEIGSGGESNDLLCAALACVSGLLAHQKRHLMAPPDKVVGQLDSQPAGGLVGEATNLVELLVSGARGDYAIHNDRLRQAILLPSSK